MIIIYYYSGQQCCLYTGGQSCICETVSWTGFNTLHMQTWSLSHHSFSVQVSLVLIRRISCTVLFNTTSRGCCVTNQKESNVNVSGIPTCISRWQGVLLVCSQVLQQIPIVIVNSIESLGYTNASWVAYSLNNIQVFHVRIITSIQVWVNWSLILDLILDIWFSWGSNWSRLWNVHL